MARSARTIRTVQNRRRVNSRPENVRMRSYEDGSAVRQEEIFIPGEERVPDRRRRKVSRQVAQNRARARALDARFVLGLVAACILVMVSCVHFLQLRSRVITQTEHIASMETELSQLQADNDAYYSQVQSSLSLDSVKNTALNRLGLHYAGEDQIRYYNADDASYVRQYENVSDGE